MSTTEPGEGYYREREFTAMLRGQEVRVVAKPGMVNGDRLTAATLLLAEYVTPPPADARIVVVGASHGALAVALAQQVPGGIVWLVDPSYLTVTMAQRTLAANGVGNAHVCSSPADPTTEIGECDMVAIEASRDRGLNRRWLAAAYAVLRPDGQLYITGANEQGIRSTIADAEALFGTTQLLGYRRHNRAAVATRAQAGAHEPAWLREPGIAPRTWHEFDLTVRGSTFHLKSCPGVFSHDRLDDGTALLLSCLSIPRHGRVLDVGCGYGIIGLCAANLGAAHVDMVDVNLLAVAAARENITANHIARARAFPSEVFSAVVGERYDLVVTNPPFHVGKAVDYDVAHALIRLAGRVLAPDGKLVLVANRFIRYDQHLRAHFRQVGKLGESSRYQVLEAARPFDMPVVAEERRRTASARPPRRHPRGRSAGGSR